MGYIIGVTLCLVTFLKAAACEKNNAFMIHNASELIQFSKDVNNGLNFSGTTVFLGSDIDFADGLSQHFEPIGTFDNHFLGTFDGLGHTINNLNMNSSLFYSGLFGFSSGLTIRNVVVDNSCSFVNSYNYEGTIYFGGIIGSCRPFYGPCNFENNVNMASVTFNGESGVYLYFGGFIGYIESSDLNISCLKNCANYGSITHNRMSNGESNIGGIAGTLYSSQIQNCLNSGIITDNGVIIDNSHVGGIVGSCFFGEIKNCVSAGKIFLQNQTNRFPGSLSGNICSDSSISNCYWKKDINYDAYGAVSDSKNSSVSPTVKNATTFNSGFMLDKNISVCGYVGFSLVDALNAYTDYNPKNGYSKWILNKYENTVTFNLNE